MHFTTLIHIGSVKLLNCKCLIMNSKIDKEALLDPKAFRTSDLYYSIDDNICGLTKRQKELRKLVFHFVQKQLKYKAKKEKEDVKAEDINDQKDEKVIKEEKKDVEEADTEQQKDEEVVKEENKDVKAVDTDKQKDEEIDDQNREIWKKVGELGWLGIVVKEEYGGKGGCHLDQTIIQEEMSRAFTMTALNYSMYINHCIYPIHCFGSEEQKHKYLPKLCSGEYIGSVLVSAADSEPMLLRATKQANYYILNGVGKTYNIKSDIFIAYATTNPNINLGVSAFILEKRLIKEYFSFDNSLRNIKLHNCKVPVANMLGEKNKGMTNMFSCRDLDNMIWSGGLVGLMQAAFDMVFEYVHLKNEFVEFKGKIAGMYAKLLASRNYLYTVARAYDNGNSSLKDCSAVMLYSIKNATKLALDAEKILGNSKVIKRLKAELELYKTGGDFNRRVLVSFLIQYEYSS